MDKLAKKAESYASFKADFVITTIDLQDKSETSDKGTIFIKENKYLLYMPGMDTYYDGKTVWTHLTDVQEVNITEPGKDNSFLFGNPGQLFTFYQKDFKCFYSGDAEVNGKNLKMIELVPVDLKKEYSKIKIWVDDQALEMKSIRYYGKNGYHYTIDIKDFKTGLSLTDDFFIFDPKKHPEVEMIDMRKASTEG